MLITGGLGFIGSNLARRLVDFGAQVTLVDSLVPEYGGNRFNIHGIEDRARVNISDVRDRYSLRTHLDGQDFLFNLAGQTSHLDSMEDPFTDLEINCRAAFDPGNVSSGQPANSRGVCQHAADLRPARTASRSMNATA